MKIKVLILFICFLIVTLVPASAVEIGSNLTQQTDDINQNIADINVDKGAIDDDSDSLGFHSKIIQDTLNEMNSVKWYQFWKWYFYLHTGPKKIESESKIVESFSKNINQTSNSIYDEANTTPEEGEKSINVGLEAANQKTGTNLGNDPYNTGDAKTNIDLISNKLTSNFGTNYIVKAKEKLVNGDIVQYPLSHNNYVYLQFIGMNPAGDTALFLGDHNTAVRISIGDLNNVQYKIVSQTNTDQTEYTNKSTQTSVQNSSTSSQISYIAKIQQEGLNNYNKTGVMNYNNQSKSKSDLKLIGEKLMIAGGSIGAVAIILQIIILSLWNVHAIIVCLSGLTYGLFLAFVPPIMIVIGLLEATAISLLAIAATLLSVGGGLFNEEDKSLNEIDANKEAFVSDCNIIANDLTHYYNGAVDVAPVAENVTNDVEQNTNTTGYLNATDADGDGLIYSNVDNASNGTVIINNNGTYTYTPKNGFMGNDTFTYKTNDVYTDSNIATVNIQVHPVNHPPVSNNITFDIETNDNLTGQLKATDGDGDPVIYEIKNNTSQGNITLNSNGTFSYVPAEGFIGNDSFIYTAKDWKDNGNTATVQINIHPENQAPIANNITYIMNKNENMTDNIVGTDADGDPLSYNIKNMPTKGKLTFNDNGTFIYTPNNGFYGVDTFSYTAKDWKNISNTGIVTIEINNVNHAPLVQNINISTTMNKEIKGLFKGIDVDADKLTYKIVNKTAHGTLILNSNQFTYKPAANYIGTDTFTYKANDGLNDSNIGKIIIKVTKTVTKIINIP